MFYHFCQKNSKIKNGRHFWKEEKFLRIEQSILHIYPVGQNFHQNRSISHGLGDTSSFKFYHFCQKFENSKWLPFLEEEIFFQNCRVSCLKTLWVKNFAKIAISHGLGDTSNFKFYHFCQKFENSKWPPFLERGKICEN